jgi:hypothetical protein
MATYKAVMQFPYDSALPADVISITPHFNGSDPQALANALKANLIAYTPTAIHPFTVKIYDAAAPPPSYPLATAGQTGTTPTSSCPREVAICLSYYTTYNRPRYRGRLYLPASWFTSAPQARPTTAICQAVLTFAHSVLGTAMPAATNWVVWSPTEGKSQGGVNNIWCDDEWDTVRSRGTKSTTRQTGTFP